MNFNYLKLKKLICTCYTGSPISQTELGNLSISENNEKLPYLIEITEVPDLNRDGATDLADIELLLRSDSNILTALDGDGDFRSEESIELLKEADIVVTNPPFSIAREYYVPQLIQYKKKFLIIGDLNWITYKSIFPLIKDNKIWLGYNGVKEFVQPNGENKKFGNKLWFTNLDIDKRHEDIILFRKFNPNEYEKYDNYDAINIDRVQDIPCDYDGLMGVPITFLDKYNSEQFEILGLLQSSTDEEAGTPNLRFYNDFREMRQDMSFTGASGGKANGNPVLPGKSKKGNFLYNESTGEYVHSAYARILIKRKDQHDN